MSSQESTKPSAIGEHPVTTRAPLRAGVTIVTHFVVDVFSFIGIALLPMLAVLLEIRPEQKALLLALGSVCSGAVQPLIAWASDRYDTRAFGTAGFVIAVLCIGNLGYAQDFTQLAILYSLGAMGIGAFHPPAAATVGQLGGAKRSKYVAIFFLAGMIGGIVGNVFTPVYVDWMTPDAVLIADGTAGPRDGLLALRWFIPVGLVSALILAIAIHKSSHRHHAAHEHQGSWDRKERRTRWFAVWVLYATNVLRFTTNMALVYLFTEWASRYILVREGAEEMTEQLGIQASQVNGTLQAAMQIGMGGGGIVLGFLLAARFEKAVFVLFPILGALSIALIPGLSELDPALGRWAVWVAAIVSGIGFGSAIPVSMSLAQRLLPHRTSLVSGLMLGGAWMLSFLGPMGAELVQNGLVSKRSVPNFVTSFVDKLPQGIADNIINGMGLDSAFMVTAIVLACSGCIALFLPHALIVRSADQ
ncbi:MAG: MFS transporter [Phycisphaerales bacterium]